MNHSPLIPTGHSDPEAADLASSQGISEVIEGSKAKPRKFLETVELQVGMGRPDEQRTMINTKNNEQQWKKHKKAMDNEKQTLLGWAACL